MGKQQHFHSDSGKGLTLVVTLVSNTVINLYNDVDIVFESTHRVEQARFTVEQHGPTFVYISIFSTNDNDADVWLNRVPGEANVYVRSH